MGMSSTGPQRASIAVTKSLQQDKAPSEYFMEPFPCSFVSIIRVSRYERQINTKARQAATARKRTNFSSFSISKLKLFANHCSVADLPAPEPALTVNAHVKAHIL